MKIATHLLSVLAVVGLAVSPPLLAEEAPLISASEAAAKREQVLELKARAKALRNSAEAAYQQETADCRQAVLVNNCLTRARDHRLQKVEQARSLEMEEGMLEREIRRFELSERRSKRAKQLEQRNIPATITVEGGGPTTLMGGDQAGRPEKKE